MTLGVLSASQAREPQLAPLPVEAALARRAFAPGSPLRFSPDGNWLLCTLQDNRKLTSESHEQYARSGVPILALGVDVGLINASTGELKNLTGGKGNNWMPSWSPDGRYVAFFSDRDGSGLGKLWVWEAASGRVRKVSEVNVRGWGIEWLRGGREVLLGALPENLTPAQYAKRVLSVTPTQGVETAHTPGSTAVIYRSEAVAKDSQAKAKSDPWSLEDSLRDLVAVDIAAGKVRRLDRGHRIDSYAVSPDGTTVVLTRAQRFEKPSSQQILYEAGVIDLGSGQSKVLASGLRMGLEVGLSWGPDSRHLAYMATGMEANGDIFVLDGKDGSARKLSDFPERKGGRGAAPLWDEAGRQLYFIHEGALWTTSLQEGKAREVAKFADRELRRLVTQGDHSFWSPDNGRSALLLTYDDQSKWYGFSRVDLQSGQATRLIEQAQCYGCLNSLEVITVTPGGHQLAYYSADAQHDTDLWLSDVEFHTPHRLTHLNPQFDQYQMGAGRLIEWHSADGEKLNGALLLPAGYRKGERYPLIVYVYGGSKLSDHVNRFGMGDSGPFNMQLFATRGYAVLLPDAPQHLSTPMVDLAKTILPGVEKVIEMGVADPERLGLWGHSYGGYSTFSLIVQTTRFKAALAADGVADLIAAYGQMDKNGTAYQIGINEGGQGLMGGTPWEYRERYIENSPIFYLDRVATPLLIVQGAEDTAVHAFLSEEAFVGLRRLGKEVEYVKYEGEGHSPLYWSYANQLDFVNRMLAWFDQHLGAPRD